MGPDAKSSPVSPPKENRATYADIEALPENVVGQILDGELFAFPRPSLEHSSATSALTTLVNGPFQLGIGGPGGWWILDEAELHLGDDVAVPYLAGWRAARLRRPSGLALKLAPDWVCEALSPSTASVDRVRKMRPYLREGVDHAWLLDPLGHTLEVFERSRSEWKRVGAWADQDRVRAAPFEEVEIQLGLLWPGG